MNSLKASVESANLMLCNRTENWVSANKVMVDPDMTNIHVTQSDRKLPCTIICDQVHESNLHIKH